MTYLIISLHTALFLFIFSPLCGAAEFKKLYRWVDENGNVFYADKVSPKDTKYRRSALNKQGISVEVVEGAKSKAQIEREAKLMKLRSAQQQLLDEHRARDRSLLRTFRSEKEINETLDAKLSTISILETVTLANITRLEEQLATQQKNAAQIERDGKTVPPYLIERISGTKQQIEKGREKIASLGAQKLNLRTKYGADLERFRDLVDQSEGKSARLDQGSTVTTSTDDQAGVIVSVANCPNRKDCDKAWVLAKRYIEKNATTPISIDTDMIIYTATPLAEEDIALSVSRITAPDAESSQIFLDVRCRQSGGGQDLCASDKVRKILLSFRPYIESRMKNEVHSSATGLNPAIAYLRPEEDTFRN